MMTLFVFVSLCVCWDGMGWGGGGACLLPFMNHCIHLYVLEPVLFMLFLYTHFRAAAHGPLGYQSLSASLLHRMSQNFPWLCTSGHSLRLWGQSMFFWVHLHSLQDGVAHFLCAKGSSASAWWGVPHCVCSARLCLSRVWCVYLTLLIIGISSEQLLWWCV